MDGKTNFGKWELWGPLRARYEARAKAGGPYRLLALDGGGIRGLITLEVLVRLEHLLPGRQFLLYFTGFAVFQNDVSEG